MNSYKILISCYACSPYRGSEPGMGWNFVKGISKSNQVHVIVEKEKWEKDINKYIKENPTETKNLTFHFIQKKRNRKLRKIWPPSYYFFYRKWQKEAYELANTLHKKEDFDLTHQLNMVGFREPGYLWKMDIPFVWGPIGGMENTSWNFLPSLGIKGLIHFTGRNIINGIQKHFAKRPENAAKRNNSMLIAATPDNKNEILKYWTKGSEIITEVGQVKVENNSPIKRDNEPLKIVWSALHEPRKNLSLLIKALALVDIDWELHILGEGSETEKWKTLTKKLSIENRCKWYGWLPLDQALNIFKSGHLFIITSIHDLTSTVTLEALSYGLPIICLDHCGFSYVVNENCGIKIPVTTPKEAQQGFANAIEKLYLDEDFRLTLAKGALERAKDFSWEKKIEKINTIYHNLLK